MATRAAASPANVLVSSRIFPFPPSRLYDAFADPSTLALWWGPHGATSRFEEFDLRPGGRWRFTMEGPWGSLPMAKTFTVVEPGRRVTILHKQEGHTFTLDMTLEAVSGGTRLTWRTTFETAEQLSAIRELFARGNEENFDRLATVLGHAE